MPPISLELLCSGKLRFSKSWILSIGRCSRKTLPGQLAVQSPRDLEIVTRRSQTVAHIADLMAGFAAAACHVESPEVGPWRSTAQRPVYIGSYWGLDWHFGCWEIEGVEVEVVHVVAPGGHSDFRGTDGIWDTDPRIWAHIRTVSCASYKVPVVPLEIQLETNLLRWLGFGEERFEARAKEIIRVFKESGYDRALFDQLFKS